MLSEKVAEEIQSYCALVTEGRLTARRMGDALRPARINQSEFRLLWLLYYHDDRFDQTLLAARLGISAAQVTSLVDSLKHRQWIASHVDSHDRRRQLWTLTPTGKAKVAELASSMTTFLASHLSEGQASAARRATRRAA